MRGSTLLAGAYMAGWLSLFFGLMGVQQTAHADDIEFIEPKPIQVEVDGHVFRAEASQLIVTAPSGKQTATLTLPLAATALYRVADILYAALTPSGLGVIDIEQRDRPVWKRSVATDFQAATLDLEYDHLRLQSADGRMTAWYERKQPHTPSFRRQLTRRPDGDAHDPAAAGGAGSDGPWRVVTLKEGNQILGRLQRVQWGSSYTFRLRNGDELLLLEADVQRLWALKEADARTWTAPDPSSLSPLPPFKPKPEPTPARALSQPILNRQGKTLLIAGAASFAGLVVVPGLAFSLLMKDGRPLIPVVGPVWLGVEDIANMRGCRPGDGALCVLSAGLGSLYGMLYIVWGLAEGAALGAAIAGGVGNSRAMRNSPAMSLRPYAGPATAGLVVSFTN